MSTIRFFGSAHGFPLEKGPYNAHSYKFTYSPDTYGWNTDGSFRSKSMYDVHIWFEPEPPIKNPLHQLFITLTSIEISSHDGFHVFSQVSNVVISGEKVLVLDFKAETFEQREGPTPLVQKKENGKPRAFDENADFGRKIRF